MFIKHAADDGTSNSKAKVFKVFGEYASELDKSEGKGIQCTAVDDHVDLGVDTPVQDGPLCRDLPAWKARLCLVRSTPDVLEAMSTVATK